MTGIICLWSGAIVDIPNGWALCDGNNGTPDLRNLFVVGAGDTYAVDASAGNLTHTHTGDTVEETVEVNGSTDSEVDCLDSGADIPDADGSPVYDFCTQGHSHSMSFSTGNHDHDLDPDQANHLPPYYALAYIMKI